MEYSFLDIIAMLNQNLPQSDNFAFRLARNANMPGDYYLEQFMPSENRPDWHTTGGTMTIVPTILGEVAMDTPYPPMGNMQASSFFEKISKFAGQMFFTEAQQRELVNMINGLRVAASMDLRDGYGDINTQFNMISQTGRADGNTINGARINAILGISAAIQKSHFDTREYLRGQAMTEGAINYVFNNVKMDIDYKIPANNIKTYTVNDRFDQSASKWWDFVKLAYKMFANPKFIMNSNAYYDIVDNDVNKIETIDITGMDRRIAKYRSDAITQKRDARERLSLTVYNKAGAIMDVPTNSLKSKAFIKDKRVVVVGDMLNGDGIELANAGVTDPDNELRLGYTHVGPTIEGGGRPGIYARIFSPEGKPYQVLAETATNMLPVIWNPKKLLIAKFD